MSEEATATAADLSEHASTPDMDPEAEAEEPEYHSPIPPSNVTLHPSDVRCSTHYAHQGDVMELQAYLAGERLRILQSDLYRFEIRWTRLTQSGPGDTHRRVFFPINCEDLQTQFQTSDLPDHVRQPALHLFHDMLEYAYDTSD